MNNNNKNLSSILFRRPKHAALIQWILDCSSDISLTYLFVGEYSVL